MRFDHFVAACRTSQFDTHRRLSDVAAKAHKFAFNPGDVTDEVLVGSAEFARQLIGNELFPLPYDECLFQFGPGGMSKDGWPITLWVLVWKEPLPKSTNGKWCLKFTYGLNIPNLLGPSIELCAGIGKIVCDDHDPDGQFGSYSVDSIDAAMASAMNNGAAKMRVAGVRPSEAVSDDAAFGGAYADALADRMASGDAQALAEHIHSVLGISFENLIIALGLMNVGKGIRLDAVEAPKFANAQRAKKGRLPIYSHHVLTVDIGSATLPGVARPGMVKASPRMHWRRGHIRTLPSGKRVAVQPCIVGDVSKGLVGKDYRLAPRAPVASALPGLGGSPWQSTAVH